MCATRGSKEAGCLRAHTSGSEVWECASQTKAAQRWFGRILHNHNEAPLQRYRPFLPGTVSETHHATSSTSPYRRPLPEAALLGEPRPHSPPREFKSRLDQLRPWLSEVLVNTQSIFTRAKKYGGQMVSGATRPSSPVPHPLRGHCHS